MAVCTFALVASEFMPVSLLTPLATDLQVSEGMAGHGIAISGAFAVATSLSLPLWAGGLDRKRLLLALTAAMALSGAIVGLAASYPVYLLGRALVGVAIGGFWSLSAATTMRLVPAAQVPRALAMLNGGNALATVLAAPLAAYLGTLLGWRGAFLCLVPVALIAFVWQWRALPPMQAQRRPRRGGALQAFALLRRRHVAWGMAASSVFFMGQFALFTYVRPFLETVTQLQGPAISGVLLVMGLAGFAGTLLVGLALARGFYGTLIAIPLVMAAVAVALVAAGGWTAAVVALLGLWGLAGTAAPVGWWAWIAASFPHEAEAEAGGGLLVAVVQLAIALGSALGGLLLDHSGHATLFLASAALLLLAAGLTRMAARTAPAPAA
jgi:predicted MFS family arabinose efflux permease